MLFIQFCKNFVGFLLEFRWSFAGIGMNLIGRWLEFNWISTGRWLELDWSLVGIWLESGWSLGGIWAEVCRVLLRFGWIFK